MLFCDFIFQECPAGTYGRDGQCLPCLPGQFNAGSGRQWCALCAAGSYQDQSGATACKPCSVGHYQDEIGQSVYFKKMSFYRNNINGKAVLHLRFYCTSMKCCNFYYKTLTILSYLNQYYRLPETFDSIGHVWILNR